MWEKRKSELSRDDILPGWRERATRRGPLLVRCCFIRYTISVSDLSLCCRGHLVSDEAAGSSAHHQPVRTESHSESHSHSPYHWTRELVRAEEKDPHRYK